MFIQIVGALAAITSTISLVPQIYKSLKTKSVSDLSILMLINFLATSLLWMVYGFMIASAAVTIANIIMTLFSLWMLLLRYKYSPKKTLHVKEQQMHE